MMLAFTVDSEGIPSCKIGRRPELHRLTQAYEEPRIRAQIFISLSLSLPFSFFFTKVQGGDSMHRDPLRKRRTQASVALSFLCNGLYTCCHACNQHSQWHATYTYVYMYRYIYMCLYIYMCMEEYLRKPSGKKPPADKMSRSGEIASSRAAHTRPRR